ncbi:MAG: DUF5777 family beta-barrel protein [Bacteroidales bacterium]
MKTSKPILLFVFLITATKAFPQNDLMKILNQDSVPQTVFTTGTFESTRIMNGHSVERMPAGQLDVRLSHRFGRLNSGAYEFFGLDQANMHFSFEYGILNWLMVGIGRGNYEKTYDGFVKFTILRQSTGAHVMPVSVSYLSTIALKTLRWPFPDEAHYFSSRFSYVNQILVARKITDDLSLQIAPAWVHRNLVATELDPNDVWAIGAGGRMKITRRISFNAEYYAVMNPKTYMSQRTYNPLALGFDIQTGGHVFQLIFTNSLGMIEKAFIAETTGDWLQGDIHFGFNISRVFTLKKPKIK